MVTETQLLLFFFASPMVFKFGCWEEVLFSGTCQGFPNLFNLGALQFSHEILAWLVVKSQGLILFAIKKCIPIKPLNALVMP